MEVKSEAGAPGTPRSAPPAPSLSRALSLAPPASKGHSVGKSQVPSGAGSAKVQHSACAAFLLWVRREQDWRAGARAFFRMLPQGLRTWLDGDSRSRHQLGQARLSPLPCLGSQLTTLPSSLSPASVTLCCKRQLWVAPGPGKGPPVCFSQFPKGEPTHVTFQGNEHPGKCSWFQSFLDALASPKKTGLQSNVSVFSRPQADSRTCREKHCHSVLASTTSTWGAAAQEAKFAQRPPVSTRRSP